MPLSLRNALFTPATRPDRFARAAESGAELLIIDLEDAVAESDKIGAREVALRFLTRPAAGGVPRALRMNGLDTTAGLSDAIALLLSDAQPDYVLLPKTESAIHLQLLDRLLQENGKHARLIGLIESARALRALSKIVVATPRLAALMLGAADLSADLGCSPQAPNLVHARVALVEACATAGIQAIDSPFFDLNDVAGLQRETALAVDMGFSGKAAIHPAQVPVIRQAFTPSPEAIAEARAVLLESQQGVGQVNGRMVDEAIARKARRTLAAAGISPPNTTSNPFPKN